jgi:hypothetical protein
MHRHVCGCVRCSLSVTGRSSLAVCSRKRWELPDSPMPPRPAACRGTPAGLSWSTTSSGGCPSA